jgi:hypothetical protein
MYCINIPKQWNLQHGNTDFSSLQYYVSPDRKQYDPNVHSNTHLDCYVGWLFNCFGDKSTTVRFRTWNLPTERTGIAGTLLTLIWEVFGSNLGRATGFHVWSFRGLSIYLSIYLSIHLWLYSPLLDLGRFFSFLILYTEGRTPWTGGSAHCKAATYTQNNTNTE